MRKALASLLPIVVPALTACGGASPSKPPEPAATHTGRWQQDVNYVCDNVARLHKDAFWSCPEERFEAARDELLADVPELNDAQIVVRLAGIVALLNDAHTTLPLGGSLFPALPFQAEHMQEGYTIFGVLRDCEQLLGARIVGVGGVPMEEAAEIIGTAISHENEFGLSVQVPNLLRMPRALHALGLSDSPEAATFSVQTTGGQENVTITFPTTSEDAVWVWLERDSIPLSSTRTDEHYWHVLLPEQGAVFWQYNRCREDPERPFDEFAEELLADLDRPEVRRLVLDLRRNRGGSELVVQPVLDELYGHRLNRPGGLIVLIGAKTYSSAKGLALRLRNGTDAVLMGNPLGQRPNTYGEVKTFQSPNFGALVGYSTKYFPRGSDDDVAVFPDVRVPASLEDWQRGIDRALETALAYEPD